MFFLKFLIHLFHVCFICTSIEPRRQSNIFFAFLVAKECTGNEVLYIALRCMSIICSFLKKLVKFSTLHYCALFVCKTCGNIESRIVFFLCHFPNTLMHAIHFYSLFGFVKLMIISLIDKCIFL